MQTALECVKSQSVHLPEITAKIKTQINEAITAHNTAAKAFLDTKTAKSKHLASPTDLA